MTCPEYSDLKILDDQYIVKHLLPEAKALLAEEPSGLPIWAVGCLWGNKNTDEAEIIKKIDLLLKAARDYEHTFPCHGNPVRRSINERVICRTGGFAVPGLYEKKLLSGADAILSREDVKRFFESLNQWPLKDDYLLRSWFGEPVIDASASDRRPMGKYKQSTKGVHAQGKLVRAAIEKLAKNKLSPTVGEAFTDVLNNPESYSEHVKDVDKHHRVIILKDEDKEMNRKSFGRAFKLCFNE